MTGRFQNRNQNLGPGHARDFTGERAGVMRAMGKLETKEIAPETKRALDVGNREPGVIHRCDLECRRVHKNRVNAPPR